MRLRGADALGKCLARLLGHHSHTQPHKGDNHNNGAKSHRPPLLDCHDDRPDRRQWKKDHDKVDDQHVCG